MSGNFSLIAALTPDPIESGPVYLTTHSPSSTDTDTTSTLPPKLAMAGLSISRCPFTACNCTPFNLIYINIIPIKLFFTYNNNSKTLPQRLLQQLVHQILERYPSQHLRIFLSALFRSPSSWLLLSLDSFHTPLIQIIFQLLTFKVCLDVPFKGDNQNRVILSD